MKIRHFFYLVLFFAINPIITEDQVDVDINIAYDIGSSKSEINIKLTN